MAVAGDFLGPDSRGTLSMQLAASLEEKRKKRGKERKERKKEKKKKRKKRGKKEKRSLPGWLEPRLAQRYLKLNLNSSRFAIVQGK